MKRLMTVLVAVAFLVVSAAAPALAVDPDDPMYTCGGPICGTTSSGEIAIPKTYGVIIPPAAPIMAAPAVSAVETAIVTGATEAVAYGKVVLKWVGITAAAHAVNDAINAIQEKLGMD